MWGLTPRRHPCLCFQITDHIGVGGLETLGGVVGLAVLCRAWANPWCADTPPCCEQLGWVLSRNSRKSRRVSSFPSDPTCAPSCRGSSKLLPFAGMCSFSAGSCQER